MVNSEATIGFSEPRIPITLLTGYLGSGKTTLLNALLNHPGMEKTAVIINEFGDAGLDHQLVTAVSETIVLLQSGCLCCTLRGDLIETLHDLLEKSFSDEIPSFDRIIVETTGLADPTPVFHTLMTDQLLAELFELESIVVTVDATLGFNTLDHQKESTKQVALADRIILTKLDMAETDQVEKLETRLRTLNPAAKILHAIKGDIEPALVLGTEESSPDQGKKLDTWLQEASQNAVHIHDEHHHHDHDHNHDHDHDEVQSMALYLQNPINRAALQSWLDQLSTQLGIKLLRMKGLINVEGLNGPLLIQGVQHIFYPPVELDNWPSDDKTTRIVVIGEHLTPDEKQEIISGLHQIAQN